MLGRQKIGESSSNHQLDSHLRVQVHVLVCVTSSLRWRTRAKFVGVTRATRLCSCVVALPRSAPRLAVAPMALRQFRLSPSGCQSWHTRVMGSGGNYFVYCSTLAVYVYNLETLALEKLLTGHKRTITCLSWSPHTDDVFATCANDAQLIVWSASLGRALSSIAMPPVEGSAPIAIDWSPTREHIVAVADTGGSMHMWDTSARTVSVSYNRIHKSRQGLRVMRWNPHQDQLLASGHADGSLCLYLTAESSVSRMAPKDRSAVVDLQWDPLSPFYMIVAYKAGDISLWDMESETELHQFNRQGTGLRSLAWMEWAPGSFASVNSRTGVIQVWNVSQKHPQDLVRVGNCGFHSMTFVPGSQQALCAFGDGSVAVFHMGKRQTQFHGSPGHTETIFDVQYRPSDANTLATASYDSTVKLWHTPTMECTQTLVGHEGVVYCVSWPGTGDDHIASCSSTGDLYVIAGVIDPFLLSPLIATLPLVAVAIAIAIAVGADLFGTREPGARCTKSKTTAAPFSGATGTSLTRPSSRRPPVTTAASCRRWKASRSARTSTHRRCTAATGRRSTRTCLPPAATTAWCVCMIRLWSRASPFVS